VTSSLPRAALDQTDPDSCRDLFRMLVAGVGIVTATGPSGPVGLTASSILAVSVAPPLLLVSLANGSRTLRAIRRSSQFAANLLPADQRPLADRFANSRPAWARFADVELISHRPPVLAVALAAAVCDLVWTRRAGDHTLLLGQIHQLIPGVGQPLVWHDSAYHRLAGGQPIADSA
jgi:flavin reductase (DIM6/NTAB) family NADH-FMN oxidoreductase RutF